MSKLRYIFLCILLSVSQYSLGKEDPMFEFFNGSRLVHIQFTDAISVCYTFFDICTTYFFRNLEMALTARSSSRTDASAIERSFDTLRSLQIE